MMCRKMHFHFSCFVTFILILYQSPKAEGCQSQYTFCDTMYLSDCCGKIIYSSGAEYDWNVGTFCNMKDAPLIPGSSFPFKVGCCQRCWSVGDGCAGGPCCPGYSEQANSTCPSGNICVKDDSTKLKRPSCYTEGMYCSDSLKCCEGTSCNMTVKQGFFGTCDRDPGFTGPMPDPPKALDLPIVDLDLQNCMNKFYIPQPTTVAPTTDSPIVSSSSPIVSSSSPIVSSSSPIVSSSSPIVSSSSPGNQSLSGRCAREGDYCDDAECCENLECPYNWWPLYILRWLVNWIGLWYRVCRNYPQFVWYYPWTWLDY